MGRKIIIGSRGSDLALWQAKYISSELEKLGHKAEIKIIKTQGDKIQHLSFDKMEGKGFFTKEIEAHLLDGSTDLAVHSHKDLPTENPPGLKIAAVSSRANPRDLILVRKECVDITQKFYFKKDGVVGTSSARRKSQVLSFRPDAKIKDIRGNVPTRIDKLRKDNFDAILIAAAGVERLELDLSEFLVVKLDPTEFIPAPAQGVLAFQIREDDQEMEEILRKVNDDATEKRIHVERKVLNLLDGGCQMPLGSYCIYEDGKYQSWTAKSQAWNTFPKRIYLESETPGGMAERILEKLNSQVTKSVFITRDLDEESYFQNALQKYGYEFSGNSLIEISSVPFQEIPKVDWIFFSSKNGVKHFFAQNPKLPENVKFATTGKGTKEMLNQHGYEAEFEGFGGDMRKVGQEFAQIREGQKVLFPQVEDSNRSIQKQLKDVEIHDLVVYKKSEKENVEIPETEVAVLTSPSNAEVYFKHATKTASEIISIGSSTAEKLRQIGVENFVVARTPDEAGLAEAVFSL